MIDSLIETVLWCTINVQVYVCCMMNTVMITKCINFHPEQKKVSMEDNPTELSAWNNKSGKP